MSTDWWTRQKWSEVEQAYIETRRLRGSLRLKRALDVLVSSLLCLILFLPVFLVIGILVKATSPGPILFRQKRLGRLGTEFEIYKFRTMVDNAEKTGAGLNTYRDDPRVTRIGKLLREFHLDELPQLLNVLGGQMSLVGPRPVLVSALLTYDDVEKRRLLMPPGMTGWQQVNGGALNDVNERIRLDVWYVENWTPWLDLVVLIRTIKVVVTREGVYGPDGRQSGRYVDG